MLLYKKSNFPELEMEPGQLESLDKEEEGGRRRSPISRMSSRESVCLSRRSSREGFEGVGEG